MLDVVGAGDFRMQTGFGVVFQVAPALAGRCPIRGRLRRFPSKAKGGYNFSGLIMDTNSPDTDSWWYKLAEVERPRGYTFFDQPPAIFVIDGGDPDEPAKGHRRRLLFSPVLAAASGLPLHPLYVAQSGTAHPGL